MPDANGNPLIGDLIGADVAATVDQVAKNAAAVQADADAGKANQAKAEADKGLASGLAKVGPTFVQDTAGNVTVYLPDSTPAGFHTITPRPVSTPVPPDPTPTPPAS